MRKSSLFLVLLALGAALPAHADDLVVSAASSLTNAFQAVAKDYEAKHPGTHVVLNFAASDVLLQQITNGAPADVFASADQAAMDKAQSKGVLQPGSRKDFAANQLVLIAPSASTLKVDKLSDLTQASIKRVGAGDPASVPVGRYTKGALEAQKLWETLQPKLVLAQNVRQSLDYVARDEVDAGFVFATDASIAKDRVKVIMTVPTTTPVTYPMAVVAPSKHAAEAKAFEDYVLSAQGQGVLTQYGFLKP